MSPLIFRLFWISLLFSFSTSALFSLQAQTLSKVSNRLEEFLEILRKAKGDERAGFYEMGLNSDHPLIYYHSLDWVIHQPHIRALPIMESRLRSRNLSPEAARLTHIGVLRLHFHTTNEELRLEYLKILLERENPHEIPELFHWIIQLYSALGSSGDLGELTILDGIKEFTKPLRFARERLQAQNPSKDLVLSYILTYRSPHREMRSWALERLSQIEDRRVATFLTRLHRESSLNYGLREWMKIQDALLKHQDRFSDLYPE